MTGPEHYREAERLLDKAANTPNAIVTLGPGASVEEAAAVKERLADRNWDVTVAVEPARVDMTPLLLAAQVHATLALAAPGLRLDDTWSVKS